MIFAFTVAIWFKYIAFDEEIILYDVLSHLNALLAVTVSIIMKGVASMGRDITEEFWMVSAYSKVVNLKKKIDNDFVWAHQLTYRVMFHRLFRLYHLQHRRRRHQVPNQRRRDPHLHRRIKRVHPIRREWSISYRGTDQKRNAIGSRMAKH